MTSDFFPDTAPARPLWLVTLADLALLLVGFFVLVLAMQGKNERALAAGIRQRFGGAVAAAKVPTDPMPVAAAAIYDFAPGSAEPPASAVSLAAWVRQQAADTRVVVKVTGIADGTAADVDPIARSGGLLAADRARAVAIALTQSGALPADRVRIATIVQPGKRGVVLTTYFAGGRQ